jgi:hypothetical protein
MLCGGTPLPIRAGFHHCSLLLHYQSMQRHPTSRSKPIKVRLDSQPGAFHDRAMGVYLALTSFIAIDAECMQDNRVLYHKQFVTVPFFSRPWIDMIP